MKRGKSDIQKRLPAPKFKEVRIPIKQATARNILALNEIVGQKLSEVREAQAHLQNHVLPICTEKGLPEGTQIVQVTEKAPWELVVKVPR